MNLADALIQLDRTEANLSRAETTWNEMSLLIPETFTFISGSDEGLRYLELARDLEDLVASLPKADGDDLKLDVPDPDDLTQARLDAQEIGEISILRDAADAESAPAQALAGYRQSLDRARRKLVRQRVSELFHQIDEVLADMVSRVPRDNTDISDDAAWKRFIDSITESERLAGSSVIRSGRWNDLQRHMGFAQGCDAHDILENDWPMIRSDLEQAFYGERDPIQVEIKDLDALVAEEPKGTVAVGLAWDHLSDDEAFERLIFLLIDRTPGYENPEWLTKTNAPDRSRDLSAYRVTHDQISGTTRQRVIIQCKQWLSNSVGMSDVSKAVTAMALWDSPPVDVLAVATSGRFTSDAVAWIEKHNLSGTRPRVEKWPDTHLELALARHPELIASFGLST